MEDEGSRYASDGIYKKAEIEKIVSRVYNYIVIGTGNESDTDNIQIQRRDNNVRSDVLLVASSRGQKV